MVKYVIIQECCNGNEMVGDMWLETLICNENTTIKEIMDWKKKIGHGGGKTIISKKTEEAKQDYPESEE